MGRQLPANVDIAAPVLYIDGVEIDKFMGATGFTFENPSDLLRTFDGTVVGSETNSESNEVSMTIAVHSESRDIPGSQDGKTAALGGMGFLELLVKSGKLVTAEVKVPTAKLKHFTSGQVVYRKIGMALLKGGGGALGGKNTGAVTFTLNGANGEIGRLGFEVPVPDGYTSPV